MLHIQRPEDLRIGQVLCLHHADRPDPDLESDENPFVALMVGMDSTSVHGIGSHFYACDRRGMVLNRSGAEKVLMPMRINPAQGVDFIPVVQLKWSDVRVRAGERDEKYVVYSPKGALLQRLSHRNVHFRMPDGSTKIADAYEPLYFRPFHGQGRFTLEAIPLREDPQDILQAFADGSGCRVDELVFVPSG